MRMCAPLQGQAVNDHNHPTFYRSLPLRCHLVSGAYWTYEKTQFRGDCTGMQFAGARLLRCRRPHRACWLSWSVSRLLPAILSASMAIIHHYSIACFARGQASPDNTQCHRRQRSPRRPIPVCPDRRLSHQRLRPLVWPSSVLPHCTALTRLSCASPTAHRGHSEWGQ